MKAMKHSTLYQPQIMIEIISSDYKNNIQPKTHQKIMWCQEHTTFNYKMIITALMNEPVVRLSCLFIRIQARRSH